MRYWHPFADEAVEQMKQDGIEKLVILPLYPQARASARARARARFRVKVRVRVWVRVRVGVRDR